MATLSVRGKRYSYTTVPGYNAPVSYELLRDANGPSIGRVEISAGQGTAKIAPGVGSTPDDLDVLKLLGALLEQGSRVMPHDITIAALSPNPAPFSCPYQGCGEPAVVNFHVGNERVLTYSGCGHSLEVTVKIK